MGAFLLNNGVLSHIPTRQLFVIWFSKSAVIGFFFYVNRGKETALIIVVPKVGTIIYTFTEKKLKVKFGNSFT